MTTALMNNLNAKGARFAGVMITVVGALLMSLDPIFIRFSGVSGVDTAFLFGLFTAISMPIFIQLRDERGLVRAVKESGWHVLLSGLLMLGSAAGLVMSIKLTTVANTFVILSAAPALAALFSWWFLGEVTQRSTWIAIVAVVCLSLNQVQLRKHQHVSRMASVGFGGLFLAMAMLFWATPSTYSANTWLIMGLMGLFTAPFGRVLSQVATRYITAPEVGMILMIETVLAPLWALIFFDEIPAMASILGGSIILVTISIYAFSAMKSEQK
ncbi:EamA family transporter [Vibrio harveyi]|uniref:DMT family transporter n=1 Tax=Vibrio harveyi TaxID=669 RepID=UPI0038CD1FBB